PQVVARSGRGGRTQERGDLLGDHAARGGPVGRVTGEGQPQTAGHPQRPRLQRHAPLELAATVGNRVAERQHPQAAAVRRSGLRTLSTESRHKMRDCLMTVTEGRDDIQAAAAELDERLPDRLAPLVRVAYNYWWAWLPG